MWLGGFTRKMHVKPMHRAVAQGTGCHRYPPAEKRPEHEAEAGVSVSQANGSACGGREQ